MKTILFFLAIIVGLTGCESAMKASYGIKDPAIENEKSVKSYLQKNNVKTENVLIFKDLESFGKASKAKMLSIPEAMFFNVDGNFVNYKKTAQDCNAKVDDFILDLKSLDSSSVNTNRNMNQLSEFLTDFNGNTFSTKGQHDAYVFINWAIFAGKLNHEKAFEWVSLLEKANSEGLRVKYYLVNCDFQEKWNLTEEQKQSLGLTKTAK